ncbi:hypothetical protein [Rhizobium sp. Root149]|uniref:hypothetical protein n=1 Tax=Rhizobium sp. Root149 TaxID=1736473 RepID=UPI000AE55691|nr:hypothetical protein [Rhizobium sp. Root149]
MTKKLFLSTLAALLTMAASAFADITVTDVKGRTVTVPKVPERVVLGFYYEDYLAIAGPGALDKVVALSLSTWKDWRPNQFALYEKALPRLSLIPDVGNTEDNTFSIEKVIAAKPDLLILAAWSYEALAKASSRSRPQAFQSSSSTTTPRQSKSMWPPPWHLAN